MIPYMVGKLAPNSSHLTKGLVNMSPIEAIFVPFPPTTGKNMLHPLPPQSLNLSTVVNSVLYVKALVVLIVFSCRLKTTTTKIS